MKSQNGNVLFLILIAVSLFAALSFVATRTGRNSGDTLSKEKADLLAAEIISYAAQMEQAVSRMILINKVPEYGFDFSASNYSASLANSTCTGNTCKIFNTLGGDISPKLLPRKAWDYNDTSMTGTWKGKIWFRVLQIQDVGSSLPELVIQYPGLNQDVCMAINKRNGITASNIVDSYGNLGTHFASYSGNLTTFPTTSTVSLGDENTIFRGKRTFCSRTSVAGSFHFWHVLLAR